MIIRGELSEMFVLSPSSDKSGVTTMGEFEVAPALLIRTFGAPSPGDGYKISGEFVFVDSDGEPFILHDWKSTNLWESGFPSPAEFWAIEEPQELSISTRDLPVAEFEHWLTERIERRA